MEYHQSAGPTENVCNYLYNHRHSLLSDDRTPFMNTHYSLDMPRKFSDKVG